MTLSLWYIRQMPLDNLRALREIERSLMLGQFG